MVKMGSGHKFEWTKVQINKRFSVTKINNEGLAYVKVFTYSPHNYEAVSIKVLFLLKVLS